MAILFATVENSASDLGLHCVPITLLGGGGRGGPDYNVLNSRGINNAIACFENQTNFR